MNRRPVSVHTDRLAGLRTIVTGGARGIGAEIARRYSSEGAEVVILDRLAAEGRETAEAISGRFLEVDLADPAAATAATEEAIGALGGVDVLVNSAGILRLTPLLDITLGDWDEMFRINVGAMLLTMQATARAMITGGTGGTVVNLASMAAKQGGADEAHYAASKAAVVALTRVAALEWGVHGITVNCLCPGYVLTEMGAPTRTEEDVALWSTYSPLGRLGQPADVAGVAAFLASADGEYLTGQAINVTGGMLMH
jgi:NAD(P)-dependent dehydrogenase (short-subunit alcohol dehydrogenase family)